MIDQEIVRQFLQGGVSWRNRDRLVEKFTDYDLSRELLYPRRGSDPHQVGVFLANLTANQNLARRSQSTVWIVTSGVVRLISSSGQLVGVRRSGQIVMDYFDGDSDGCSAITATTATALFLTANYFRKALHQNPALSRRFVTELAQQGRIDRVEQGRFCGSTRERLIRTLAILLPADEKTPPKFSITNEELADMICSSTSSLDSALRSLNQRGVIEPFYRGLMVTDSAGLLGLDSVASALFQARSSSAQPVRLAV